MRFIAIVFVFFSISLSAQEVSSIKIENIDSEDLKKGDTVSVSVTFNNVMEEISSFQLYINYNKEVVEYLSTENVNELFKGSWTDNATDFVYAAVFINFQGRGLVIADRKTICEIKFLYKGGETELGWGKERKENETTLIEGETIFTTWDNKNLGADLINGCVCKLTD